LVTTASVTTATTSVWRTRTRNGQLLVPALEPPTARCRSSLGLSGPLKLWTLPLPPMAWALPLTLMAWALPLRAPP